MMENKNAHPVVAATEQASGNAISNFQTHFTPEQDFGQLKISDYLSTGQVNAVNLRYLRGITRLPGREIRRLIQRERMEGIPICSDNVAGYYLPANDFEKMRCARSMRHRAAEIDAAASAIESAPVPGGR